MLPNPKKIQKYLYIEKTPTWKVRGLYLFGLISWSLIVYGYIGVVGIDPFYSWFVLPILFFLTIYHLISFGLNLFYTQFDLKKHLKLVKNYREQPWVDVYLPICGEEIDVLRNTWQHVLQLNYQNKKIYVLDDSKRETTEHEALAKEFGFTYFERPNKGEMKKAGNLKYAYERTKGEFIFILDADFAPHPDFLLETLPYMAENPKVGIVQTPQYFDVTKEAYKVSPFAYNAAYAEEPFYRFIQVTRNRFGGSICCGSNAVYRRSALDAIGGPYQIDYSEDAHTGFAMTKAGYQVFYIPVILAIGLSPDNAYAFFHQQHRWSMGSMRLMLSKQFWQAKISWKIKFCYVTGFLFYLHHPLIIIFPLQLFWTLFFYNEYIPQGTSHLFYPNLIFAITYLCLFPIARFRIGYFEILTARTYAYAHAVKTAVFRKSVAWISTNAKQTLVSAAFHGTTKFILAYVFVNIFLILLGLRSGDIHLFNIHYWSIQFWIFWNFGLSVYVLLKHLKVIKEIESKAILPPVESISTPVTPIILLSALFSLGFLFFEVVYGHIGFLLGQSITQFTLPISFTLYCVLITVGLLFVNNIHKKNYIISYFVFIAFSFAMLLASTKFFSQTFDTSWDGQGYHSNGIISFASGWNPVFEKELPQKFPDASIFVKGYPKAVWLIQSSFYLTTSSFNSGKVTNLIALLVALAFAYTLFQQLKIRSPLNVLLALILVFQAPFFMQFTSFMADQFSFEMLIIAIASLGIFALNKLNTISFLAFIMAESFLIGTKFSNLPLALALACIFLFILVKKFQAHQLIINRFLVGVFIISSLIFAFIPYGTNLINYKHLFFPTNLKEISQSYKADNIPSNLQQSNRLNQLFYSLFSQSQMKQMEKSDPANIAHLKIPFTFSLEEVKQSALIYNNRVGSAGPLFSGILILSIIVILLVLFTSPRAANNRQQILLVLSSIILCLILTLLNPAPNLLRYNGQIILIPFILIAVIFSYYQQSRLLKIFAYAMVIIIGINTVLFDTAVISRITNETAIISGQLSSLHTPDSSYELHTANFYSNYIRLKESHVAVNLSKQLTCSPPQILEFTHYTSIFCQK